MRTNFLRAMVPTAFALLLALGVVAWGLLACGSEETSQNGQPSATAATAPAKPSPTPSPAPPPQSTPSSDAGRPNILWVVWDTVRADHLSLYGYQHPTTPKLEEWSKQARVFENVISTASTTVPSHAAMFTGLLPNEHGANDIHRWLDEGHHSVAERLSEVGYQTFLWAANPHIAMEENFQQGFDVEFHPWDPATRKEAISIVTKKAVGDRSARNVAGLKETIEVRPWATKAAGELAERGLLTWLRKRDEDRPWFAFVNYMEAHRPLIPSREARLKMMNEEDASLSYVIDRSWVPMWSYVFGLRDYTPKQLKIMSSTYDATLTELDLLFSNLLTSLEEQGVLDNTVIILTADHGEHLGEHHMLDHQYSLYRPLINVPLVIHYPKRFAAGRDTNPVMNFDLFPTVLELAGVDSKIDGNRESSAKSLLHPDPNRQRMSQYPSVFTDPIPAVQKHFPNWDPTPFRNLLYALQEGRYKILCGKPSGPELYDVEIDPGEIMDQTKYDPDRVAAMSQSLHDFLSATHAYQGSDAEAAELSPEHRQRLEALGYLIGDEAAKAGPQIEASENPCSNS